jgi:hypothetical protein
MPTGDKNCGNLALLLQRCVLPRGEQKDADRFSVKSGHIFNGDNYIPRSEYYPCSALCNIHLVAHFISYQSWMPILLKIY